MMSRLWYRIMTAGAICEAIGFTLTIFQVGFGMILLGIGIIALIAGIIGTFSYLKRSTP